MARELRLLPHRLAIARLGPGEATPAWALGPVVSITRTPTELSVVCSQTHVPVGVQSEPGWRCFKLTGPIDLDTVGVLASLTRVFRDAAVGVFVVSTYDTDYILVRGRQLAAASQALEAAGYSVIIERDNG